VNNNDLSATIADVRVLHSHVVDAICAQESEVFADIVTLLGGLSSQAFVRAVYKTGLARICSSIKDDQLIYSVQLKGADGWVGLCGATATDLGFEDTPELRDKELQFHTERLLREMTGEGS
jgi:hypothetical protein